MGRTGRRTWVKLHTHGILHGSVSYQLTEAEQIIWVKLICLAGECNRDGQISDNDGRPYPHLFIAHELHCTEELLESALFKCNDEGRTTEDETGIHITNWSVYQSEYQRQKPYRDEKEHGKKMFKKCPQCKFKAETDEIHCPKCAKDGKKVELEKDYAGGKFGHIVKH